MELTPVPPVKPVTFCSTLPVCLPAHLLAISKFQVLALPALQAASVAPPQPPALLVKVGITATLGAALAHVLQLHLLLSIRLVRAAPKNAQHVLNPQLIASLALSITIVTHIPVLRAVLFPTTPTKSIIPAKADSLLKSYFSQY